MKRSSIIWAFLLACTLYTADVCSNPNVCYFTNSTYLIKDDKLNPFFAKLLELTGIEHNDNLDITLCETQEKWFKKKERWEIVPEFKNLEEQAAPLLESLHTLDDIQASKNHYDYALIHGALFPTICKRIDFLASEWNRGVRFDQLVLLTGDRDLHPSYESIEAITKTLESYTCFFNLELEEDKLASETDLVRLAYDCLDLPKGLQETPCHIVSAGKQLTKNNTLRRPNTTDTLVEWLKSTPLPGSCLLVSNQPYVGYQNAIAHEVIGDFFKIETIGPKARPKLPLSIFLDNFAKWFFSEYHGTYLNERLD